MNSLVLGIDIGGTMIKGGLFTDTGELVKKKSIATRSDVNQNEFIVNIINLISLIANGREFKAVGVGIAGVIDARRTTLVESPNLPQLNNMPIKEQLSERLAKPVCLENDANIAALGERWGGAGRDMQNFLLFTLGTGIGSGLILDGKLWVGETGKAGEFGHVCVDPHGARCGCGKLGCLEAHSSGTAIVRMAQEALENEKGTALHGHVASSSDITPELLFRLAMDGDEVCLAIYKQMAIWLAIAIADVNNLLDIHAFIIGGGVSKAAELFVPTIKEELDKRVFAVSRGKITLATSTLGNDAGIFGAGCLAAQACKK